uniref:Uncharacterized protein n=1 Tax=Lepeophtheirus salmonis TaxID=72036 RepID=A0A0K2U824_LEPSM
MIFQIVKKKFKLDQIFQDSDLAFRTRLIMNNVEDLSKSRLEWDMMRKKRNKSKDLSIMLASGEISENPTEICKEIKTFFPELYQCFDFTSLKKCSRFTHRSVYFCEELRCNADRIFTIPPDDNNFI